VNAAAWSNLALVAAGGAIGSVARWAVAVWIGARWGTEIPWPWPTFSVNIVGSLLIGLVSGMVVSGALGGNAPAVRLFFAVGIMGGFTTFSSLSMDLLTQVEAGKAWTAFAYAAVSIVLGLAACAGGAALGRLVR
jgi:CrcB protein